MKLGILTDIHEHTHYLQQALDRMQAEQVDQVVVIGDLFETGERIDEICWLLDGVDAIGVWGNHDYGLSCNPDGETRDKYSDRVIDFMTSLTPRLQIADCHFTHVEPWLNPEQILDLWYFEGPPRTAEARARIFDAVSHRLMFTGHNHQWLLATRDGTCDWQGDGPVDLSKGRYFVVVGALCEGHCALLDTDSSVLTPIRLAPQ